MVLENTLLLFPSNTVTSIQGKQVDVIYAVCFFKLYIAVHSKRTVNFNSFETEKKSKKFVIKKPGILLGSAQFLVKHLVFYFISIS